MPCLSEVLQSKLHSRLSPTFAPMWNQSFLCLKALQLCDFNEIHGIYFTILNCTFGFDVFIACLIFDLDATVDKRRYKIRRDFETVKDFNVYIWLKVGLLEPGHISMATEVRYHGNKPQNISKQTLNSMIVLVRGWVILDIYKWMIIIL